jgi:hypothetical protein
VGRAFWHGPPSRHGLEVDRDLADVLARVVAAAGERATDGPSWGRRLGKMAAPAWESMGFHTENP